MHLVIDGYNLLGASPELAGLPGQEGRDALMSALKLYRDKKRHRVTVVFDGGPDGQPTSASISGVPALFSGAERSADDVIADLAGRHGPGITVVTDDRELAGRCAAAGSEVVASWEFAGLMMSTATGSGPAASESGEGGWDFTTKKKGPQKRLPKKRRRRARRIDRL